MNAIFYFASGVFLFVSLGMIVGLFFLLSQLTALRKSIESVVKNGSLAELYEKFGKELNGYSSITSDDRSVD